MLPVAAEVAPAASRVVLFVADGLRADRFFELVHGKDEGKDIEGSARTRAPFLRSVMRGAGAWGISHTRVPTESRPGHVALLSGLYEDLNPALVGLYADPFDSVFNGSSHAWTFGSPDIMGIFNAAGMLRRGGRQSAAEAATAAAVGDATSGGSRHFREQEENDKNEDIEDVMSAETYDASEQDFGKAAGGALSTDKSYLDAWVFDRVRALFRRAGGGGTGGNATLAAQLRRKKSVFFLHLLGLDTNGHAHRPDSPEYLSNIKLVDAGVAAMVAEFEAFYGHDGRTAFVFTADHGMGSRGSHGDGHPENTRTPLVVWGAGVQSGGARQQQPRAHQPRAEDWADVVDHDRSPAVAASSAARVRRMLRDEALRAVGSGAEGADAALDEVLEQQRLQQGDGGPREDGTRVRQRRLHEDEATAALAAEQVSHRNTGFVPFAAPLSFH